MSKDKYIKAEAVPVFVGDNEFDGIRVIDTGKFRVNLTQLLLPFDLPHNWFNTVCKPGSKNAEALQALGFSQYVLPVEYSKNGVGTRAKSLSLGDATVFVEYQAFDKENPKARIIARVLIHDSLQDRWEQVWNERRSTDERRADDNRIMQQNAPYAVLYRKDVCDRAFGWFGCQFYWDYFYFWMTAQERCDLDNRNPPVKGRRKTRIHQWIEPETKERLRDKAIELGALILASRSKQQFIELFQNRYGKGWQTDIFS